MQDDPRNMFCNHRREFSQEETPEERTNEHPRPKTYEQRLAEMQQLAAKYQKEGESQLVKDILDNVLQQKASGNLTNEQLVAFAKRISPLLNAEQRTRLDALVQQLLLL